MRIQDKIRLKIFAPEAHSPITETKEGNDE